MATKYDRVYYWHLNAWHEAIPGSWPAFDSVEKLLADTRRMGYHAVPGCSSIGAPEGPPRKS